MLDIPRYGTLECDESGTLCEVDIMCSAVEHTLYSGSFLICSHDAMKVVSIRVVCGLRVQSVRHQSEPSSVGVAFRRLYLAHHWQSCQ
jgi:hypothetical protein